MDRIQLITVANQNASSGFAAPPAVLLSSTQSPDSLVSASNGFRLGDGVEETLDVANSFTYAHWFQNRTANTNRTILSISPTSGLVNRIDIQTASDSGVRANINLYDSSGTLFKSWRWDHAGGAIGLDIWYMLAFSWDGSNLKLYWDGAVDSIRSKGTDNAGTMTDTARGVWQNSAPNGTFTSWLRGRHYQSGLWSSVLTDEAITNLFDNPTADWREDFSTYTGSGALEHYWVYGEDMTSITTALQDYGVGANPKDLDVSDTSVAFPGDWVTSTP